MSRPRRAVVVDDSRVMRRIMVRIVSGQGFETLEAGDGLEALHLIEDEWDDAPIDLLVADWNMPEMSGVDLVRSLRADPRYAGLAIVMATSESEIERVEEALAAGADEYLMKPFDDSALSEKLEMLGLLGPCPAP
jgi:two-component system chemotaxis response regulator CheY